MSRTKTPSCWRAAPCATRHATTAALRAADAFNTARRRRDNEPLVAALIAHAAAPPATDHDDLAGWPVIDQAELRRRAERDRRSIPPQAVLIGDRRSRSAQRQLGPWLHHLSETLAVPLSPLALELACEQWRARRAPYFDNDEASQVRFNAEQPTEKQPFRLLRPDDCGGGHGGLRPVCHPSQPELEVTLMTPGPPLDPDAADFLRRQLEKGQMGGLGLRVDDCRKTYEDLSAKGVTFLQEPSDRPYGVEAVMRDNSGNWLVLVEPKEFTAEDFT